MKRVTKFINEYIVQENHGYGWDDSVTEETYSAARAVAREYRENGVNARTITRRVPNPAYKG